MNVDNANNSNDNSMISANSRDEFISAARQLIRVTTKETWKNTINIICVSVGLRNLYFRDSDDITFNTLSGLYQRAFLEICRIAELKIEFIRNGRWLLYNNNIDRVDISTDESIGKLLDFPCSHKAMDMRKQPTQKMGIEFNVKTEYGDLTITQFFCFKKELPNTIKWIDSKKRKLAMIKSMGIFKKFEPYLFLETYKVAGRGAFPEIDTEEIYKVEI